MNEKVETIRQAHEERVRQRLNSISAVTSSGEEEEILPIRNSITRIERVLTEPPQSENKPTTQRFRILCRSSLSRQQSKTDDDVKKDDHQPIPIELYTGEHSGGATATATSASSWTERRRQRYARSQTSPDILKTLVQSIAETGTTSATSARLEQLLKERESRLENSTLVRYVPTPRQDSSGDGSASASATESEASTKPEPERRSRFRRRTSICPDRELSADGSLTRKRLGSPSLGRSFIDYASKAKPKLVFGRRGENPSEMNWPRGICCIPGGEFAVCDSSNHRVQVFNTSGRLVRCFGAYGTEDGELDSCAGIAYHRYRQQLAVSDRYNHRIQMFDLDGKYVKQFGGLGVADGRFNNPWGVAVDEIGLIYVVDKVGVGRTVC